MKCVDTHIFAVIVDAAADLLSEDEHIRILSCLLIIYIYSHVELFDD